MKLLKEVEFSDKPARSEHLLVNRVKVQTGLLSKRASVFLLFNALYGFVFSAHFAYFFRFSLEQEYAPHFSLILLVSLYLLSTRGQQLCACTEYWVPGGIPLVLVGILGYLLGFTLQPRLSQNDVLALTTLGVVTIWIGGFVTFFGLQATKIALFPLGFLMFMIPLPEALLSHIITALQYASADMVDVLFQFTPLPVLREDLSFTLPGLSIEVARECSSIRSSMALLITSTLGSHLLLRRCWSKAVVVLLVFPLAVFKNGVRIVTLTLLTLYVDKGFMHGGLHARGGAVFFGLACAFLLLILVGLRKLEAWQAGPRQ
jgi:exosortase